MNSRELDVIFAEAETYLHTNLRLYFIKDCPYDEDSLMLTFITETGYPANFVYCMREHTLHFVIDSYRPDGSTTFVAELTLEV